MIQTTRRLTASKRVDRDRSAAIIVANGHLLLMERWREGFGQYYVIPGGGVEPGERRAAAVRREVREETGLNARIIREVFHGTTPRGNVHSYYLAEAPFLPVALPRDAEERHPERVAIRGTVVPRWIPINRLARLRVMPPTLKPYLLEALRRGFPKKPIDLEKLWSGPRPKSVTGRRVRK